ncbi:exosortase/archaeosortase family protein [Luteolibacter pohnpeiensis]|uniref:Exosortase/archaeosortase family protein n=1 Tax=Luteolibacter pohnpeiensis TaxID=454153 RepID=A0A934VTM9_9BACT|nr:exosortase/archaeosortase family protein [Luteolibacter pohnpeiensis]MBK1881647.1 exosortase/archaeosortase family protein [Luteolibacter pohnpeiensis]
MSRPTKVWLCGLLLILAAIGIWLRDTSWIHEASDMVPLAVGVPLAWFLGGPWKIETSPVSHHLKKLGVAGVLVWLIGWVVGSITALTVGWTAVCVVWATWAFAPEERRGRLSLVLLFSFPWLVLEWPQIGWLFRLTSAELAEGFFKLLAMPVVREGTHLRVMNVPVDIEAACAGWNLLQLTLLAGVVMGAYEIRAARRFYGLLLFLPILAWVANFLRILILTAIALSFDVDLAAGTVHGLTGLVILFAVLAMTKGICRLLEPKRTASRRVVSAT